MRDSSAGQSQKVRQGWAGRGAAPRPASPPARPPARRAPPPWPARLLGSARLGAPGVLRPGARPCQPPDRVAIMPAVSKGDGMRGLAVFISDIRNCERPAGPGSGSGSGPRGPPGGFRGVTSRRRSGCWVTPRRAPGPPAGDRAAIAAQSQSRWHPVGWRRRRGSLGLWGAASGGDTGRLRLGAGPDTPWVGALGGRGPWRCPAVTPAWVLAWGRGWGCPAATPGFWHGVLGVTQSPFEKGLLERTRWGQEGEDGGHPAEGPQGDSR